MRDDLNLTAPRHDQPSLLDLVFKFDGQRMRVVAAYDVRTKHPDKTHAADQKAVCKLGYVVLSGVSVATEGDVQDGGVGSGGEPVDAVGLGPHVHGDELFGEVGGGEEGSDSVEWLVSMESRDGVWFEFLYSVTYDEIGSFHVLKGLEDDTVSDSCYVRDLKVRRQVRRFDFRDSWNVTDGVLAII